MCLWIKCWRYQGEMAVTIIQDWKANNNKIELIPRIASIFCAIGWKQFKGWSAAITLYRLRTCNLVFRLQPILTTSKSVCKIHYLTVMTPLVLNFLSNLADCLASKAGTGLSPMSSLSKNDTTLDLNILHIYISSLCILYIIWLNNSAIMTQH